MYPLMFYLISTEFPELLFLFLFFLYKIYVFHFLLLQDYISFSLSFRYAVQHNLPFHHELYIAYCPIFHYNLQYNDGSGYYLFDKLVY